MQRLRRAVREQEPRGYKQAGYVQRRVQAKKRRSGRRLAMGTRRKARETYGSGSVTKQLDADGRQRKDKHGRLGWRVCVHLGTEAGGKRRKVQRVVYGTLEDARAVAKRLSEEYEHIDRDASEMGFAELCGAWETAMRNANACSPERLRQNAARLRKVSEAMPGKPLAELKRADVEQALAAVKEKSGYGQTTVREVFSLTKRVFRFAVDSDWMVRNPCDKMTAPRVVSTYERRSMDVDECARFREAVDRSIREAHAEFLAKERRLGEWSEARAADKVHGRGEVRGLADMSCLVAVRLIMATGMRRGEALGLEWGCVDLEGGAVTARQSRNGAGVLKSPKTSAGVRTLCVDDATRDVLRWWKEAQADALEPLPERGASGHSPVVCSGTGGWVDAGNFDRWWRAYREEIGFGDLLIHELRHTQATLLLGSGADIKTVQTRLGHASASLTLDQYAHAMPANDKAAAQLMGSIFGSPSKVA